MFIVALLKSFIYVLRFGSAGESVYWLLAQREERLPPFSQCVNTLPIVLEHLD